jgi:hypothetical protein
MSWNNLIIFSLGILGLVLAYIVIKRDFKKGICKNQEMLK